MLGVPALMHGEVALQGGTLGGGDKGDNVALGAPGEALQGSREGALGVPRGVQGQQQDPAGVAVCPLPWAA